MQVALPPARFRELREGSGDGEGSDCVAERVRAARERQRRWMGAGEGVLPLNARLTAQEVSELCTLDGEGASLLRRAMEKLGLSARAYHRILRVARTIVDLAGEEAIAPAHVAEAIQYRSLDRLRGTTAG